MIKTAKRTFIIVGLAALASSCRAGSQDATNTPVISSLRMVATSATAPLARELVQSYIREDALFIISVDENNWQGLQEQLSDNPDFYGMTTFLPDNSSLWAAPIGEDAIAIITHPDVNVPLLTAAQLRNIFSGTVENWREVGGPDLPLVVVSPDAGADTRLAFERMVMGDIPTTGAARLAATSPEMLTLVSATAGSIGYVSWGLLDERVRPIPVTASPDSPAWLPNRETLSNQTYPLRTPILLVGQRQPATETETYAFFAWLQQGDGQGIIAQRYFPLRQP